MFLNVCKQAFHISHVCISQKIKGVLIMKSSTYYFHMKPKILADFQIYISTFNTLSVACIILKHTVAESSTILFKYLSFPHYMRYDSNYNLFCA